MDKKIIMLGMILGSIIGGYISTLFGAETFSLSSILASTIGGLLGIWLSYKIIH